MCSTSPGRRVYRLSSCKTPNTGCPVFWRLSLLVGQRQLTNEIDAGLFSLSNPVPTPANYSPICVEPFFKSHDIRMSDREDGGD